MAKPKNKDKRMPERKEFDELIDSVLQKMPPHELEKLDKEFKQIK